MSPENTKPKDVKVFYRIIASEGDILLRYNITKDKLSIRYSDAKIGTVSNDVIEGNFCVNEFNIIYRSNNLEFLILNKQQIVSKDIPGNNIFMHGITEGEAIRYKNEYELRDEK
ncbi:hypothetical protein HN510_00725 [Candidatus Woesearchaeota archaeon]|jgi:hypothetical protein|nr:hypothetical protein [Candidatus Woesearchaeota archaeon]